jgi:dUTP pyrophosphatase
MIDVKIKTLSDSVQIPIKATMGSAGHDIRADEDCEIFAGEVRAIKTGLAMEVPYGFECQIRSRSGLAMKHQVFVPNSPGTIDSDYRDEVKVLLYNASPRTFKVSKGDRIAQLIFARVENVTLEVTDSILSVTERTGGFGSSGVL